MQLTAIALWLNTAFAAFDESLAVAIHKLYLAAPGFFTPVLTLITYMGKGGAFLILLSIVLMLFPATRRFGTSMLLGLAIGALITNICVKPLVARPRPYTWDGSVYQKFWIELGKHTESDKSFPSGHMTAAMAASTAVFLRGRRKISWTAFLFAIAMGISRIYLSVHYATDVLGGVVTGGVGGVLGYFISLRLPDVYYGVELRDLMPGNRQRGRHEAGRKTDRRAVVLDGRRFATLEEFYAEASRLFGCPEDEPLGNLDALNDALRGGLGAHDVYEPLTVRWKYSEKSRRDLGAETFRRIVEVIRARDTGHDCRLILE